MKKFRLCFIGWVVYSSLDLLGFTVDALMGLGGSGNVYEKCWLFSLIFASPLIFIGTMQYFLRIFLRINKIILIILSLIVASLQIVILMGILFFIAMMIVTPILTYLGYYVTMP
jgi:hypothetical protein